MCFPLRFIIPAALLSFAPLWSMDLKPGQDGVAIDAGTLGHFTLDYPTLLDGSRKPAHKQIEVKASGTTATVRYEGGEELSVSCAGGDIIYTFAHMPDDVKSWQVKMLIDISFGKGGTWKIGGNDGSFPASKPEKAQLHQSKANRLELKIAQGQSLRLTLPDHTFQQLTDNREWNWPIYRWTGNVPFSADKKALIRVEADLTASARLVDMFGQAIRENYPGKVKTLEELKADVAADEAYYAALPTTPRDEFGGLPGSGPQLGLQKTGYFHIEQRQGKSWLTDPAGNAFFHLGVCGFLPNNDYTHVKGRESIYQWLPKTGDEFDSAFREGNRANFSFHLANTIRKFGEPHTPDAHTARMVARVQKWGFNSIGAFSPVPPLTLKKVNFPYVAHLPTWEWLGVPRLPGAFEVWDPFDETTRKKIEENIAREVPSRADDPLLIGWFIVNEPRFDELPKAIPALPKKHAAKRRFVQSLRGQYQTIEAFNKRFPPVIFHGRFRLDGSKRGFILHATQCARDSSFFSCYLVSMPKRPS